MMVVQSGSAISYYCYLWLVPYYVKPIYTVKYLTVRNISAYLISIYLWLRIPAHFNGVVALKPTTDRIYKGEYTIYAK